MFERIAKLKNVGTDEVTKDFKNRTEIINWMIKNNIRDYKEVAGIIAAYYQAPDETMKKIGSENYGK